MESYVYDLLRLDIFSTTKSSRPGGTCCSCSYYCLGVLYVTGEHSLPTKAGPGYFLFGADFSESTCINITKMSQSESTR